MNQTEGSATSLIGDYKPLNFTVFPNQVGGHSCLLKPNKSSDFIIKPFNEQEFAFYEQVTKESSPKLLEFVPKYYGMYSLDDCNAEINVPDLLKREDSKTKLKPKNASCSPIREEKKDNEIHLPYNKYKESGEQDKIDSKNSWFRKLYLERFKKNNTKFLKLQDLTNHLSKPCVLDLKMGSISYNPQKMTSQMVKIATSSSIAVSFRICGLFVNQIKAEKEEFRDKYWGRKIPTESIPNALAFFFYDGNHFFYLEVEVHE